MARGSSGDRAAARTRAAALLLALTCAVPSFAAAPRATLPGPSPMPFAAAFEEPFLAFADARAPAARFIDAVRAAVARSPAAGAAGAAVDEARGVKREAVGATRPRLDLDVSGQQVLSRAFANDPQNILERSRPDRRVDATATAEQTLLDFGAGLERVRAARARTEAARAGAAAGAEDAAVLAITAWYDVYLADADAELAGALARRHEAILGDTRRRVEGGAGAEADIARVEAYLAAARAREERAWQAGAAARLRYAQAFGTAPPLRLDRPRAPAADGDFVATVTAAARVPAVAAARERSAAARHDFEATRADRLPRLIAGVDAGKYSLTDDIIDHDVRARLTLRQRIYGGGSGAARADQAAARRNEANFTLRRAEDEAARDAGIAWQDARSLDRQAAILRDAYVASRRTRDAYAQQFRVARGSLIELLRAEVDLEDAAAAYLRAVAQADLARYTLLERTGGLLAWFAIDPPEGVAR